MVLVVVIVAIVAVVIVVAGIVSVMTQGLVDGGSSHPVVTLAVTKTSSGAEILVAGIQPATYPGNFWVNIEDVSTTTFGTAVGMPVSPGGSVTVTVGTGAASTVFSVQWVNLGGSGQVSQGDHIIITWMSGPYAAGTTFAFWFLWNDGATLTSIDWQA